MLTASKALKLKHSKNEEDSKYLGSVIGKSNEHGDVRVEGGQFASILIWEQQLKAANERPPEIHKDVNGHDGEGDDDSRPGSSGLSSIDDQSLLEEEMMDLS